MSRKSITIAPKPDTTRSAATADDWVKSRETPEPKIDMKRLTLDVPADLHRQIKTSCASRGVKMAEELRDILESHYSKSANA